MSTARPSGDGPRRARPRPGRGRRLAHAARVAALVTAIMAVLYVGVTVGFDMTEANHLVASVDQNLAERLSDFVRHGAAAAPYHGGDDVDQAPVVVWRVSAQGRVQGLTDEAPPLPAGAWSDWTVPTTVDLRVGRFRALSARVGTGWLVVGQSLAENDRLEGVVTRAEVVAGPVILAAVFCLALGIGVAASRPVEQARRRQLEFTADASHELRTPLTVIEAEVGLALSAPRDEASYRETLARISTEAKRLRRIVEDMLFLARSDSAPPAPGDEVVDLGVLAEECAGRFEAVARSKGLVLGVTCSSLLALVKAPPEPLDRLCGVLVDNACRYTGPGGQVAVSVSVRNNLVSLVVDDSGPGIEPAQRQVLFDRFRRGTDEGEGSGLGLAIADAVVRSTGGRWRIGTSPQGGAHMEVYWRRQQQAREAGPGRTSRGRAREAGAGRGPAGPGHQGREAGEEGRDIPPLWGALGAGEETGDRG